MAKKEQRKAREEAERRASGVQAQVPEAAPSAPAASPKKAVRAARAAAEGKPGA